MMSDKIAIEQTSSAESRPDPAREAFLKRPLGGLMIKNAAPAVASMLFMALYQVVDGIMVGRSLGPDALASVNILYPVIAVFVGLAVMIGVGGNARIAVLLGAGETARARRVLGLVVALGTALGIAGTLIILLASPQLLAILGTSGELGGLAGRYLMVIGPFATPLILIFILEQSVRNDGRPNLATAVMAATAVLNIILDYLFLFPMGMGIGGAALASGISQSLGAAIFLGHFTVKTVRRHPGLRLGAPGGGMPVIRTIAVNGASEMFNSLAAGLTTFLFNRMLLSYIGATGVAAFALVQYLLMIGAVVIIGICNGTQPILSYNYGAGLSERVQGTLARLMAASLAVGFLFFAALRWQAGSMAALFIPGHPEALALTLQVTGIVSWSVLFMPVGIAASVFFTALEKAGSSLVVSVSRSLIFILIGLALFPLLWGETGIWVTPVFAEAAATAVAVFLICRWAGRPKEAAQPAARVAESLE